MTAEPWVHPTHGRLYTPKRHQSTIAKIHHVARASNTFEAVKDMTAEERILLAIFGLKDGESVADALRRLRNGTTEKERRLAQRNPFTQA